MIAEEESLVAGVDDHRVAGKPGRIEVRKQATDVVVHRLDRGEIVLHVALILPAHQRFPAQRDAAPVQHRDDGVGLERAPLCQRSGGESGGWSNLEIAVGEVIGDPLRVFVNRVAARRVVVPECHRFRDALTGKVRRMFIVGLPRAMRRLVMHHEKERLVAWTVREKPEGAIGYDVGGITARVALLARRRIEHRIEVRALPRQNFPPVETHRIATQVPFADHPGVVATLLQQSRNRHAVAVEAIEDRHAVDVRVLSSQDCRTTGRADRVGRKHARKQRSFAGDAVDIWSLVHARSIRTDGVRGVIVRHDVQNVRTRGVRTRAICRRANALRASRA